MIRSPWFLATLIACALVASDVSAQSAAQPTDLWMPSTDDFARVDDATVSTVFAEVLGGPSGAHHIVGQAGIAQAIAQRGFALPPCFEGLDVCSGELEAAVRALDVDRVVYAVASGNGESIVLTLVDVELNQRVQLSVRGRDLRETVFAAVSAVTDASGQLSLDSDPSGAEVRIDGVLVGTTPYESTIGIGAYALTVSVEGYYDYTETVEVRANEHRVIDAALERRYAQVSFLSDAPGAEIVVNGDEVYPAGEPFFVLPGTHAFQVRAPGYDPDTRELDLIAGEERTYRVTLAESAETIARRKRERILDRPLTLQLGFVGEGFRTDWNGARTRIAGERERFRCPFDSVSGDCQANTPAGEIGLDLEAFYDAGFFELQLFGFGVRRSNLRSGRTTYVTRDGAELVEGRAGRTLWFQLPSPGIRWLITEDWSAVVRTGVGVAFQRYEGTRTSTQADQRFRRTDWVWQWDVGARYHISSSFFAFAEAGLGVVLRGDTRARLGGTVGIGINLADPLGLRGGDAPRSEPRPEGTPEEL